MIHGPSIIRLAQVPIYPDTLPKRHGIFSCCVRRMNFEQRPREFLESERRLIVSIRSRRENSCHLRIRAREETVSRQLDRDCSGMYRRRSKGAGPHLPAPIELLRAATKRKMPGQGGNAIEGPATARTSHALDRGSYEAGKLPRERRTILHKSRNTPTWRNLGEIRRNSSKPTALQSQRVRECQSRRIYPMLRSVLFSPRKHFLPPTPRGPNE